MSEDNAWEKFTYTGNVMDYLTYASIKNSNREKNEGVKSYASQNRRLDNNGEINI